MSQKNNISTGTFSTAFVFAVLAASSNNGVQQPFATQNFSSYSVNEICEDLRTSGMPIAFYNQTSEGFFRSMSIENPVEDESVQMQRRYKAIETSFLKHSDGFPFEKKEYLSVLSNSVCRLQFKDNVSSYNEYDNSIDTVLKLPNGLKLSISQFLDEDIEAPAVFSIHRGKTLLISDEMPVNEIVNTINSVIAKLTDKYEA